MWECVVWLFWSIWNQRCTTPACHSQVGTAPINKAECQLNVSRLVCGFLSHCALRPTNCWAPMNSSLLLHPTYCWAENRACRDQFLLSKICIINNAGETTNSLLLSAFHSALSTENLCDLVDIFASFFDIMFKWFYCFVCCCLSLTMCWERMSASQIFVLILSMQNSVLNRHAKLEASKWCSFRVISV